MTEGLAEFIVPGISKPCQTWYKVAGDLTTSQTPLIVLHGGPGACHEYLLPLEDLAPSIPLVFYDQIGNGLSTHLPEKAGDEAFWSVKLFQDELDNLISHLELKDRFIDVCGHSWGGMLAAVWAFDPARSENVQANKVSVWLQTPLQFLLTIGEILCLVSLSGYTYTEAPRNLKALVQAFQAVAAALGAAIGIGLGPVSRNPWLVVMFAFSAGTMAITAVGFWVLFRGHDVDYAKADVVDTFNGNENGGQRDDPEAVVCKKKTAGVDSHHGEKSISSNAVKAVEISL
ncbi:hypothetical protein BOTNAR_0247g00170 [Botryotinia narcissicola]|uniref:AB hydrolase-1 domain-containing protein n=1 Tax=Botryotinia narcissicola TaxID=278944 RepID=A0A4Z1I220_9HELO|nr:hypothetical protein BOTNAR_0247g00170 [Botryotinia narcissicola]